MFKYSVAGFLVLAATATPVLAAPTTAPDRPQAHFTVSTLTAVPGKTLPPGSYTISVLDHLSDRYIVRVASDSGDSSAVFIGIPNTRLPHVAEGELLWKTPANGATYIRGWEFPGTPLEFAYPKNDAVAVAKANNAQVPAIDPESEGMATRANLSQNEMQIITLWLLSPTRVGPGDAAGIKAERYAQVASNAHKPPVARLPHTASFLPAIWLLGTLSTLSAFGLRQLRPARARR